MSIYTFEKSRLNSIAKLINTDFLCIYTSRISINHIFTMLVRAAKVFHLKCQILQVNFICTAHAQKFDL